MSSPTPEFLIETIKGFYNDPDHSDATLTVNNTKYHLLLPLVKRSAPLLFKLFEEVPKTSESSVSPPEQAIVNLMAALMKSQKKTFSISDATLANDVVNAVLESMYGKSVDITTENLVVVYNLSTKFGMTYLSDQCLEMFKKTIKLETLVVDYQKALEEKSPFENLLKINLINNLGGVPKSQLLEFTSKLSYDVVKELITSHEKICTEDLIYEIVDGWCKNHTTTIEPQSIELISLIKLEMLSVEMLTTQVKSNPLISGSNYTQALESIIKSSVKNPKQSKLSNAPDLVVGSLKWIYQGYRLITNKEVLTEKFRLLFTKEYHRLNGLYCIDNFERGWVCTKDNNLQNMRGCLEITSAGVKDTISQLRIFNDIESEINN